MSLFYISKDVLLKNKKIFLSLLIFVLIFIILGLPFTKWAPCKDDYGNLFRSQAGSVSDFLDFFINGDTESICLSNFKQVKQDFLSAYYRPMLFVYTFVQRYFLGLNSYYFYLIMIFLHALNSVIFFNLLLYFVGYLLAFISALYFAFHPSLYNWLGWFGGLQFHVHLFLFFLTIIFLKKYLDTKKIYLYLISCLFFLINIFSGEIPIIIPVWLIPAVYFYNKFVLKTNLNFLSRFYESTKVSLGFWAVSLFYLSVKLYLYPFQPSINKYSAYNPTFKAFFTNKFLNIVTCVSDFFNLSFFYCSGFRALKGSVIIFLILLLVYLFLRNKNKYFLLFLFISIILFCWPVLLIKYCNRYIYLALPFFILFILLCINILKKNKIIVASFLLLILINSSFIFMTLKKRELLLYKTDYALRELSDQIDLNKNTVSFIDLPENMFFGEGMQQALLLYSKNDFKNLNLPKEQISVRWDSENKKFFLQK